MICLLRETETFELAILKQLQMLRAQGWTLQEARKRAQRAEDSHQTRRSTVVALDGGENS
jgi:hypothetical protein